MRKSNLAAGWLSGHCAADPRLPLSTSLACRLRCAAQTRMNGVGQHERHRLSSSFGGAAAAYAVNRPDYAQAAVRWALEHAPGRRVLDLGAGTGKLTANLIAATADVIAVEPDA